MLAPDYQTPERMALKRQAIPLPDLAGLRVLDIGCDMGFWSFLAAQQGASDVLGLDRNRAVRGLGIGPVDLIAMNRETARSKGLQACRFEQIDLGRQWHKFGAFGPGGWRFDLVLLFSLYHHIYEAAGGDHAAVWHWLWLHTAQGGSLLWENPVDCSDPVARANVGAEHQAGYTLGAILWAASRYFVAEHVGPALHEPTREVWRFTPKLLDVAGIHATIEAGAGGAARAFEYAGGRRIGEIERILGFRPIAGSLNLRLAEPFDWNVDYHRAQLLDVADRRKGFDSLWRLRWARFYPVMIADVDAFAFRFEGEQYDDRFVELIAPLRLRDLIKTDTLRIWR